MGSRSFLQVHPYLKNRDLFGAYNLRHNKRPMGHINQLTKKVKSINTYDYIITLIKRRKKNFMRIYFVLHLKKPESSSPKDVLSQVWLKLAQWFLRRGFFNFVNIFSLFRNNFPLEKSVEALHLKRLESPSPNDAFYQVWLKLAQWFWRRRIFKFRQCIIAIS